MIRNLRLIVDSASNYDVHSKKTRQNLSFYYEMPGYAEDQVLFGSILREFPKNEPYFSQDPSIRLYCSLPGFVKHIHSG
jgi:hypothetical protein